MADGVIEIIIGGAAGTESSGKKEGNSETTENIFSDKVNKLLHPVSAAKQGVVDFARDTLGTAGGRATLYAMALVKNVVSIGYRIGKMELNRAFSLKENYLAQNAMTMLESEMGALQSAAKTFASNVALGASLGGPVGAVVGAAFGTVSNMVNIQIQKAETMERHNMQLNSTNAQTTFSASRAALVNGSRGTEY